MVLDHSLSILLRYAVIETNISVAVFDLPQLYTKPPADDILQALDIFTIRPHTFAQSSAQNITHLQDGDICRYLTSIIGSPLAWIESDTLKEKIWDTASSRLCERAGRNGMALVVI